MNADLVAIGGKSEAATRSLAGVVMRCRVMVGLRSLHYARQAHTGTNDIFSAPILARCIIFSPSVHASHACILFELGCITVL